VSESQVKAKVVLITEDDAQNPVVFEIRRVRT